jgi:hypothetical protein
MGLLEKASNIQTEEEPKTVVLKTPKPVPELRRKRRRLDGPKEKKQRLRENREHYQMDSKWRQRDSELLVVCVILQSVMDGLYRCWQ